MTRPSSGYVLRQFLTLPRPKPPPQQLPVFYACRFSPASATPLVALVGGRHVLAGSLDGNGAFVQLCHLTDADHLYVDADGKQILAELYALAWVPSPDDAATAPQLAVSGDAPQIKILDVGSATLTRTLSGHGRAVTCLEPCPTDPYLLASSSLDHTIRIWDLRSACARQPCSVIFSGESAREGIQSIAWHRSGRYIVSGGRDTRVHLWVVPSLPDSRSGSDRPHQIPFAHFSTSDIHTDDVDCVQFWGNLILSKSCGAAEGCIRLWRIKGFKPDAYEPPSFDCVPTGSESTRSAFSSGTSTNGVVRAFEILWSFDLSNAWLDWMHFSLSPVLRGQERQFLVGINTSAARHEPPAQWPDICFWDLARLEAHEAGSARAMPRTALETAHEKAQIRGADIRDADRHQQMPGAPIAPLGGPFRPLLPHQRVEICKDEFSPRMPCFSSDGRWCVVVGNAGSMAVLENADVASSLAAA